MERTCMAAKAFSYLRFSTPEQMRGDSFRRQASMAKQWAKANNADLDEVLTFQDLGVSAYRSANAEFGKLGELLEAVRAGLIPQGSFILIESLDRLSRDKARKSVRLLETLCELGVAVVTLTDGKVYTETSLDDDPMAFMWAFMVAMRANEESATKSRRLGQAWEQKRKLAGDTPMTAISPGWLQLDREAGAFTVISDRADVVRRMFRLTLDGYGQHKIAELFNAEGIETFGRSAYWHRSYVKKTLENSAVVGVFLPHRFEQVEGKRVRVAQQPISGYFPAIVSESVFADVQSMRVGSDHAARSGHRFPIASLLAGLAECPQCGNTMTRVAKGSRSSPKFVCTRAKTGAGCTYKGVVVSQVEAALVANASWIAASIPSSDADLDEEIRQLVTAMEALQTEIGRLLDAIASGLPSQSLTSRIRELETDGEELKARLRPLYQRQTAQTAPLSARRTDDMSEALTLVPLAEWTSSERTLANASLRQVLSAIVLDYRTGLLVLKWKHGGETSVTYGWPEPASGQEPTP